MTLATTFDPPPSLPAASVPLTDPPWRDYHTKLNQWLARLATFSTDGATAVAALQTGAGQAATAWQTASGTGS